MVHFNGMFIKNHPSLATPMCGNPHPKESTAAVAKFNPKCWDFNQILPPCTFVSRIQRICSLFTSSPTVALAATKQNHSPLDALAATKLPTRLVYLGRNGLPSLKVGNNYHDWDGRLNILQKKWFRGWFIRDSGFTTLNSPWEGSLGGKKWVEHQLLHHRRP